jgi:hypothetical protein
MLGNVMYTVVESSEILVCEAISWVLLHGRNGSKDRTWECALLQHLTDASIPQSNALRSESLQRGL